jgi:hypothetical protein
MNLTLTWVIPPREPVNKEKTVMDQKERADGYLPVLPIISSTEAYVISAESMMSNLFINNSQKKLNPI